jgi:hypothetical protein
MLPPRVSAQPAISTAENNAKALRKGRRTWSANTINPPEPCSLLFQKFSIVEWLITKIDQFSKE